MFLHLHNLYTFEVFLAEQTQFLQISSQVIQEKRLCCVEIKYFIERVRTNIDDVHLHINHGPNPEIPEPGGLFVTFNNTRFKNR